MVVYQLTCAHAHSFEAWFSNAKSYDDQLARNLVSCPACGSQEVRKLPAGLHVGGSKTAAPQLEAPPSQEQRQQRAPASAAATDAAMSNSPELAQMMRAIRDHVQQNTENVGRDFAKQARQMHEGEIPHRAIRGKVSTDEAQSLFEDGVHALPLPANMRFDEDLQ
jgi:hypothetical protein